MSGKSSVPFRANCQNSRQGFGICQIRLLSQRVDSLILGSNELCKALATSHASTARTMRPLWLLPWHHMWQAVSCQSRCQTDPVSTLDWVTLFFLTFFPKAHQDDGRMLSFPFLPPWTKTLDFIFLTHTHTYTHTRRHLHRTSIFSFSSVSLLCCAI